MSVQVRFNFTANGDNGSVDPFNDDHQCTADGVNVSSYDTTAASSDFFRIDLGFQQWIQYHIPHDSFPSPGPCEDDRPLTKDSWYCPNCNHLHGRKHAEKWDPATGKPTEPDQLPYCPHCKQVVAKSWDEIKFLPKKKIDRLNRRRRMRDD